jgi:hypothetical protein
MIKFIFMTGIDLKSKKNIKRLAAAPKDWVNTYLINS